MKTTGIIINRQSTNEYDQLVTFYSPDIGKNTGIAKSILKPNSIQSMHLDNYNYSEFELIEGKVWPIITGAQAINSRPKTKSDLMALALAGHFAEMINKIVFDNEKDPILWGFVSKLYNDIEEISESRYGQSMIAFLRSKQMELLNILGYTPNFDECGFCGRSVRHGALAYNMEINGFVCKECFLEGKKGILLKESDVLSGDILDSIFASLARSPVYSSKFVRAVLK